MYPTGTQPDPGAPGVSLATNLPQLRAWAAACEESPHGIAAVWVGQPPDPAQLPQGARHERYAMAISQSGAQTRTYPAALLVQLGRGTLSYAPPPPPAPP